MTQPRLDQGSGPAATRIQSIDVFRGLTILVMIFVNDLGGMRDIPPWLRHVPPDQNGMTLVDVVFPAFLFIVGMAIPLSLERRLASGATVGNLLGHVLIRTLGLLGVGVLMVNMHGLDPAATGLSADSWTLLVFLSVILAWNRYPRAGSAWRGAAVALRGLGLAALFVLAVIYRGRHGDSIGSLRTSWWGILGLIGWAYLVAATAWLAFRRQAILLPGVLGLLLALYLGDKAGALDWLGPIREYIWPGGHLGAHSAIAVAGMVAALLVTPALCPLAGQQRTTPMAPSPTPHESAAAWRPILALLLLAGGLAAGGYLLEPLHGISKVQATPAWCLYSSAICTALYAGLYWLVDVQDGANLFVLVRPTGSNPLLAYILPDIFYAALGLAGSTWLSTHYNAGGAGIARAGLFALVMVGLTALLTRMGIRLRF